MSNITIRVENVSKKYLLGSQNQSGSNYRTFRDVLSRTAREILRIKKDENSKSLNEEYWALKDISFEISQGERIGIIGRNGAGKSTLLKILSRITEPTQGCIRIRGRVASLLEVGTGFHPELTGRENIFLNGSILGMSRTEIKEKFDEIVAFAEIERFLDTPVKHYSSGMYVRLAFAVAAHLEPEVLIVDEVLAVGDAVFQKKCLGKMEKVANEGRTVIFVSHNMAAIQNLCNRALWIDKGKLLKDEESEYVISSYLQTSFSSLTIQTWDNIETAPGNEKVRLRRACVRPIDQPKFSVITVKTTFLIEFEYWNLQPDAYLNLSLHIYNEQGIMVFNALPINERVWQGKSMPIGIFRDVCYIPGNLMNDGMHWIELLVVQDETNLIYKYNDILVFDIRDSIEDRGAWYGKWGGAVRPHLEWKTELIEPLQISTSDKTSGSSSYGWI
jgi:lipopolysaccharide transport system ATP-binding protein